MKTREEIEQGYSSRLQQANKDYDNATMAAEAWRGAALAALDDPMARLIAAAKEMPLDHNDNHGYLHFPGISPVAGCVDCAAVVELRNAIDYAERRRAQG